MARPKPPKNARVLGKTWRVRADKTLLSHDDTAGDCHGRSQLIRYGTGQALEQEQDSVLHELIHAVWHENGLSHDVNDDKLEEMIIRRTASGVLALLKENPELVRYLTV